MSVMMSSETRVWRGEYAAMAYWEMVAREIGQFNSNVREGVRVDHQHLGLCDILLHGQIWFAETISCIWTLDVFILVFVERAPPMKG